MATSRPNEIAIGAGLLAMAALAAALIFLHPEKLRVPAWVAYGALSSFAFGGAALIARRLGAKRAVSWLGALTVCGLVIPGLWIALGPSAQCTASFGGVGGAANEWVCRIGFGAGAALCCVFLVLVLRRALRE
jgi:hypothetical protein